MDNVIKAGDVVQLRSGGCLMTVCRVGQTIETRPIDCVWFDDSGKYCSGDFVVATLRRIIIDHMPLVIR